MFASRFVLSLAAFALVGCSSKKNDDPPPPPPATTATVVFENRSNSNKTYDVVFDGSLIATLGPDQSTGAISTTPGGHTYVFKVSNTGKLACNQANPQLVAGRSYTFSCSF